MMSIKRKAAEQSSFSGTAGGDQKRSRFGEHARRNLDVGTGQYAALPLGDDLSDVSDEDSRAALAYLKSVRAEAATVPAVLRGLPVHADTEDDADDGNQAQGFYSDGCYFSRPAPPSPSTLIGPVEPSSRTSAASLPTSFAEAYALDTRDLSRTRSAPDLKHPVSPARTISGCDANAKSLKARFFVLRARLRATPPSTRLDTVDWVTSPCSMSITSSPLAESGRWLRRFLNTRPSPLQIACMDTKTVAQLLRIMTWALTSKRTLYFGSSAAADALGAWALALLARADELETMNSDEVSVVRELGKAAVRVLARAVGAIDEGIEFEGEDVSENFNGPWVVEGWKPANGYERRRQRKREREEQDLENRRTELLASLGEENVAEDEGMGGEAEGQRVEDADGKEEQREQQQPEEGEVEGEVEDEYEHGHEHEHAGGDAALAAAPAAPAETVRQDERRSEDAVATDVEGGGGEDSGGRAALLAMLDAVLVVVGDVYGQRDLLDARAMLWVEGSAAAEKEQEEAEEEEEDKQPPT